MAIRGAETRLGGGARAVAAEGGVRGREACDRNAERRARHVVEPDLVAERDRVGITAVLTADAELDCGSRRATTLATHAHELADALDVELVERIRRQQLLLEVL